MGIRSTKYITRDQAILRVMTIRDLILEKDYRIIDDVTFEHDVDIKDAVDSEYEFCTDMTDVTKFTDGMLEDVMDKPLFRYSMFENYIIGEEDND